MWWRGSVRSPFPPLFRSAAEFGWRGRSAAGDSLRAGGSARLSCRLLGSPLAPRAWAPTACAPRSRSGGSAAGERRARRSGACMAPGALVCVCVAGEGRARCPASCCSAARLPCRFIFRSAAIGPRAARLGSARPGRAGAGRAGLQRGVPAEPPGTPARLCSPNAAPGSRLPSKLAELGIPG